MATMQVRIQIPDKLVPVLEPRRFKIMHGGRGGGKSHTVAQILLMLGLTSTKRILCVREVQKSIAQSSMQVLKDYIRRLGLEAHYEVLKTEIRCRANGTTFTFSGLKDHTADSIKSFEGADLVWVEEAHSVSAHSWNILIPTILRTDGAEIWATFNPDQEDDYVYKRFVKGKDPNALVIQINWRDNPWFNDAMDEERRTLKAINADLYDHVWEGHCRSAAGLLFKRNWFKRFAMRDLPTGLNKYLASDYAGAPDPDDPDADPDWTEHGVWGIDHHGDLYACDWWSGQEDPSVWIDAWIAMLRRHKPLAAFEEKGVILRTVDGSIQRAMREAKTFVHRVALASAGSKADRALGFAARASAGTVYIPDTDWGDRLVNQLCAFTGQDGKTDDMVDVCALVGRGIEEMRDAHAPPEDRPKGVKPFTLDWLNANQPRQMPRKRF